MSLQIDVSNLRKKVGRRRNIEVELEQNPLAVRGEDIEFAEPIVVEARLTNAGTEILAEVSVAGHGRVLCTRCLRPYEWHFSFDFRHEYLPADEYEKQKNRGEQEEKEITEEVLPFTVFEGEVIDLEKEIRENIALQLPMRHLCRVDCQGLCPHCGTNLNEGECDCTEEEIDPRLEVLKDFKGESQDEREEEK